MLLCLRLVTQVRLLFRSHAIDAIALDEKDYRMLSGQLVQLHAGGQALDLPIAPSTRESLLRRALERRHARAVLRLIKLLAPPLHQLDALLEAFATVVRAHHFVVMEVIQPD